MIHLRLQSPADAAPIATDDFEWSPSSDIAIDTLDVSGGRIRPLPAAAPAPVLPRPVQRARAAVPPRQAPRRVRWGRGASIAAALVLGGGAAVNVSKADWTVAIDGLLASAIAAPLPTVKPVTVPTPQLADIVSTLLEAAVMDPPARPAPPPRANQLPAPRRAVAVVGEPSRGMLALNAVPWAQVSIDGVLVGETPIASVEMAPGTHHVTFRHPDFGERHVIVQVEAGQRAQTTVDFRDAAAPAPAY